MLSTHTQHTTQLLCPFMDLLDHVHMYNMKCDCLGFIVTIQWFLVHPPLMTVSTFSTSITAVSSTSFMTVATSSTSLLTISTNTTAFINQTLIISISVAVGTVILIVVIVLILTLLVLFIKRKTYRNEEHKDSIVNDIPMDDNVAYHHVVDNHISCSGGSY